MSERPTMKSIDDTFDRELAELDLYAFVRRVAHLMHPDAMMADSMEHIDGEPYRDDRLALLSATEALRAALEKEATMLARSLGTNTSAPVTYADLGRAVGIGREGARKRWPDAIPTAKAGRPRRPQATVRLVGGPAEWAEAELEFDRSEVYGLALDEVGAYLITPGEQIPQGVPADARAHYAPGSEDTRDVWVFQGWVEG